MTDFIARPIASEFVDRARARLEAGDATVARVIADAKPGYPCRVCLKDAEPGEALLLFTHTPFERDGPYVESGPVLAHADGCAPAGLSPGEIPEVTVARAHCVVRAYDQRGWIHDGRLTETAAVADVLRAFFADAAVAYAHVRNVGYGCFAYEVRRAL